MVDSLKALEAFLEAGAQSEHDVPVFLGQRGIWDGEVIVQVVGNIPFFPPI
jgi:hypothetical protein